MTTSIISEKAFRFFRDLTYYEVRVNPPHPTPPPLMLTAGGSYIQGYYEVA
jgi:hypothetical protein